jgi:hypothetical protein
VSAAWWAPVRWWPLWRVSRPNLPTVVGGVALLLAGLLAVAVTPRWQAEQARALALRAVAVRPASALRQGAAFTPDTSTRLWRALPPADQAPQRLAHLTGLARQHGVTIDGTRLGRAAAPADAAALPAQQLPLSMAAHGPYPAVRRFVAEALQHDDALLLDRLRLSRASPTATELAVDLQWALLQRAPAAASGPP